MNGGLSTEQRDPNIEKLGPTGEALIAHKFHHEIFGCQG